MRYIDVKRYIKCDIDMYSEGRFNLPELFDILNKDIKSETVCIPTRETRELRQEKLYKYACEYLVKAIDKKQERK